MSDWLSPTKILTYLQCPREYHVKYVLGMFDESEALRGGSAVHLAAEKLAKWGKTVKHPPGNWKVNLYQMAEEKFIEAWGMKAKPAEGDNPERFARLFRVYVDTIYNRIKTTLASGKKLDQAWQWAWPNYTEQWLKSKELKLRGIADEVGPNVSIHRNFGNDWIVDLKTNKMTTIPFKEDHRIQILLYALMFEEMKGRLPNGVALWYLDGNVWVIYVPTPADMRELKQMVWNVREGIENEDWTPTKHKFCDWCPGKGDCPEFNS